MTPTEIILHHSLTKDSKTVSWGAIRQWQMGLIGQEDKFKPNYNPYVSEPLDEIAYHFGLEDVNDYYEILFGRMMNKIGAHARGHNHNSIGICFVGNYDLSEPPPEMWNKGIHLARWICDIFKISPDNIYGHHKYATYKTCPGVRFNVAGFRTQVKLLDN